MTVGVVHDVKVLFLFLYFKIVSLLINENNNNNSKILRYQKFSKWSIVSKRLGNTCVNVNYDTAKKQ